MIDAYSICWYVELTVFNAKNIHNLVFCKILKTVWVCLRNVTRVLTGLQALGKANTSSLKPVVVIFIKKYAKTDEPEKHN